MNTDFLFCKAAHTDLKNSTNCFCEVDINKPDGNLKNKQAGFIGEEYATRQGSALYCF